jgi:hypothetical protein
MADEQPLIAEYVRAVARAMALCEEETFEAWAEAAVATLKGNCLCEVTFHDPDCPALNDGDDVLQMPCVCGAPKASEPHDHAAEIRTTASSDAVCGKRHNDGSPEVSDG